MTIEQYILERSYLPKNGTFTLENHVMAMLMTVHGVCTSLEIADEVEEIEISDTTESVVIESLVEDIVIEDEITEIVIVDTSFEEVVECRTG